MSTTHRLPALFRWSLLIALFLLMPSCDLPFLPDGPDPTPEPEPEPEPTVATVTLSPSGTMTLPAKGGSGAIRVRVSTSYYIWTKSKVDWMTIVHDDTETTYNKLVVTVEPNATGSTRSTTLTVWASTDGSSKDAEAKLEIVQESLSFPSVSVKCNIDFGTSSLSASGCELLTMTGSASLDGNNPGTIRLPSDNETPCVTLLCGNDGEVRMMARGIYSDGGNLELNARSTALAYVTMHPLLAPVKGAAPFKEMTSMIVNSPKYGDFENSVAEAIKNGKPVLDPANTSITRSLEALMNEICVDASAKPSTKATNVEGLTGEGHLKVWVEGKQVYVQNPGISPMYEGYVYDSNSNEVGRIDVPAGSDYGVTDIMFRRDLHGNKPVSFNLYGFEGEYNFFFTRDSQAARVDFAVNWFCGYLDIVGAGLSAMEMKTLKGAALQYVASRMNSFDQMLLGGTYSYTEILEFGYNSLQDFLASDLFLAVCEKASAKAIQATAKKLSKVVTIYCALRGSVNVVSRFYSMMDSPHTINFCLCSTGALPLYPCSYVKLILVSGDKQADYSQKWLDVPIHVKVDPGNNDNPPSYYIVRFTVESGGGKVSVSEVCTDEKMEARTYWMLGQGCFAQDLKIEVLDPATGGVISEEPLYVTGFAKDVEDVSEKPIPDDLIDDWVEALSPEEKKAGKQPIEITLTRNTASYHNPNKPDYDFDGIAVYYDSTCFWQGGEWGGCIFFTDEPDMEGGLKNARFLMGVKEYSGFMDVSLMYGYRSGEPGCNVTFIPKGWDTHWLIDSWEGVSYRQETSPYNVAFIYIDLYYENHYPSPDGRILASLYDYHDKIAPFNDVEVRIERVSDNMANVYFVEDNSVFMSGVHLTPMGYTDHDEQVGDGDLITISSLMGVYSDLQMWNSFIVDF